MALKIIKRPRNNLQSARVNRTLKISLVISFFLHIAILIAFQKAFPLPFAGKELRTYRVDFIRPPVEDIPDDEAFKSELAQLEKEINRDSQGKNDFDTISLDTEDKRYVTYARLIKERIMYYWLYPPEAMENLIEGSLMVMFSLSRDGGMAHIEILNKSGYDILDQEAIGAIKNAAPFPVFPDHITVSRLNIKATFDYRLTHRR